MPNRNPAESNPEYQELMAGHSPHKGIGDLRAEPPQDAKTELRERMSHLFGHRRN